MSFAFVVTRKICFCVTFEIREYLISLGPRWPSHSVILEKGTPPALSILAEYVRATPNSYTNPNLTLIFRNLNRSRYILVYWEVRGEKKATDSFMIFFLWLKLRKVSALKFILSFSHGS